MRSRDGNHSFTLSISTIIFSLLYASALFADEYIISYRYTVKDAILYNETLDISKAMQKCSGKPYNSIIFNTTKSQNLKDILRANEEKFLNFLSKLGLDIRYYDTTSDSINRSTTVVILPSKCFKVDFNENFVKIAPLK
jgi:hypothetical protein